MGQDFYWGKIPIMLVFSGERVIDRLWAVLCTWLDNHSYSFAESNPLPLILLDHDITHLKIMFFFKYESNSFIVENLENTQKQRRK